MPMNSGKDYKARETDIAQPVMTSPVGGNQGGDYVVQPMAFDAVQITSAANRTRVAPELPASTLSKESRMHVAFSAFMSGTQASGGKSDLCPSLAVKSQMAVAFAPDVARSLTARHDSSPCADRGMDVVAQSALQVRRLTPTECERLQGFPDGWTAIPFRGKPAADGPRYKALGNSMAVPVMAWIGRRIAAVENLHLNQRAA
jgi:DNA (cytosine-5)-methyltransferase 1